MTEHSQRLHALLSPSGATRWMNCTPSARLEDKSGIPDSSSPFAEEGTLAHEFGDIGIRRDNRMITKARYLKERKVLEENEFYSDEMDEEVQKYIDYVNQQFKVAKKKTKGAKLSVEQRVDLSYYIEEGSGLNDVIIIGDGTMEVIDLKYGKGVRVDAKENPQLMLYGLGALRANDILYDIHNVRLTIVQPRLDSISSWEISAEALREWGETEVRPKAEMAYAGEGDAKPGAWCRWCKVKPVCRAFNDMNLEVVKHDFADPQLLTDEEVVDIFERIPQIRDWAESVSAYMLSKALEGKDWDGYKLVEGRSMRRWADEEAVVSELTNQGLKQDEIMDSKLKSIGKIEKHLGKVKFEKILSPLVIKPEGKPTLVPESDKRSPLNTIDRIKQDFN